LTEEFVAQGPRSQLPKGVFQVPKEQATAYESITAESRPNNAKPSGVMAISDEFETSVGQENQNNRASQLRKEKTVKA